MPITARQAVSQGLLKGKSAWDSSPILTNITAAATVPIWAASPANQAGAVGYADDTYAGSALAAATASQAQGVLNAPCAALTGVWVFLAVAGAGTSTVAVQVTSASASNTAPVTTVWTATVGISTLNQGWNLIPLSAVPATRQWSKAGVLQTNVGLLYPGDIVQVVVGTAAPPAFTVYLADIE